MKALKKIDASGTVIEKLPDSITQLKGLVTLKLTGCKKLRKLPQDIGNMQGLEYFDAGGSAIEQLPDSFGGLVNLVELYLFYCKKLRNLPNSICKLKLLKGLHLCSCSNLEQLPEQLGKMQCLESLSAADTAIEQVPDSIELLVEDLSLHPGETDKISLPDSVKDMKKLSSSQRGRTLVSCWEAKLEKGGETENNIKKILQLSYDELDDEKEKSIFLDIVFFFVGRIKMRLLTFQIL
ncbi:hypothetical protein AgCh_015039 [Apium graveolens]